MPANPWELRADVRPLEAAAQRWTEVGAQVARRGDELVDAARRATEGWDAASAESYEQHRKQVLARLDRFTTLADLVADCLRAAAGAMASSQKELDRAWTTVAAVPHEVVGESRHLVFTPSEDDERSKVTRGQAETDDIRRRLTVALDQESARLRSARAEMVTVRTELMSLTGGRFAGFLGGPGGEESGVGIVAPQSTSVPGAAQAGVGGQAGLPPLAPVAVTVPDLTGLSAAGLTSLAASAAGGLLGRSGRARPPAAGTPPVGGLGAGGMAARAGTMSRGMASGRGGPARMATPRLERTASEEAAARAAREKEAVREAKRAALEEKRAERAARRAEREAAREGPRPRGSGKDSRRDDEPAEHDEDSVEEVDEVGTDADGDEHPGSGERRQSVRVVHEATPGRPVGEQRR
ncbi:hypothetical protein [uncultured Nocardioides sp.]|uniref:hypothetical protein n=1 Tax=uncultured Nocardioides sp. TaxID=198441 RepID=UPI002627941E|nr:hypothetical protein [uncultured Nocardioides sp.]